MNAANMRFPGENLFTHTVTASEAGLPGDDDEAEVGVTVLGERVAS